MIVDTSALVAAFREEAGSEELLRALATDPGAIPTPVLIEFHRVTARQQASATEFMATLLEGKSHLAAFDADAARAAIDANPRFGTGNGQGGTLNMLDLMVYGMFTTLGQPILCVGRDFAATDAAIHPASRLD